MGHASGSPRVKKEGVMHHGVRANSALCYSSLLADRAASEPNSVVPPDMLTNPTINNIFNRPVVQTVAATGVTIKAQ